MPKHFMYNISIHYIEWIIIEQFVCIATGSEFSAPIREPSILPVSAVVSPPFPALAHAYPHLPIDFSNF